MGEEQSLPFFNSARVKPDKKKSGSEAYFIAETPELKFRPNAITGNVSSYDFGVENSARIFEL